MFRALIFCLQLCVLLPISHVAFLFLYVAMVKYMYSVVIKSASCVLFESDEVIFTYKDARILRTKMMGKVRKDCINKREGFVFRHELESTGIHRGVEVFESVGEAQVCDKIFS